MSAVTCPRCDARWTGHKIEHCADCHATFTSTRAGDRHRVGSHGVTEGDHRRRCLTSDEMGKLRRRNGLPYYIVRVNPYGTLLWAEYQPALHPLARARDSDGLTAAPAGEAP